nr:long-chain acyl-CoA synthase 1 [Erycina pusilla]
MNKYTVQVESGMIGENGKPSVGPVYRSSLAKDGFPKLDPGMNTSWELFRFSVEKNPGNKMLGWREFIQGKAGPYVWATYKEVYEQVLHIGSALKQLDVAPGARIGICGANCPQWAVAMEACNGFSLICVPLYDTLGAEAIDYIIEHSEIDVVFVQDKKVKHILSMDCKVARRLKSIISFSTMPEEHIDTAAVIGIKAFSWDDFIAMGKKCPSEPLPPQPLDICTIMYTSGTSGKPKGVVLTHETHATYVKGVELFLDQFEDKMSVDDVYFSFLPLAHILDRMIEEYFFHKGASVGYYQGNIEALRDDLMELKPTFFAGVPRVFERVYEGILKALEELRPLRRLIFNLLYKHKLHWMRLGYSHKTASPLADFLAFSKVKARLGGRVRLLVAGGAPLSSEIEEFLRVTSCAYMVQGYGLTETCGQTTIGYPDDLSLIGAVGVPFTFTDLRLEEVPEMGYDPLNHPSRGEVCVRGKTLFSGYYKDPELTKEVIIDGWFHTGDIGEITPEGVLIIIDRKKNIFKLSQGEYVAAEYLEKVYSATPIIEDIWVYGNSYSSRLVAVVTPHEDNTKKWALLNGHNGSFNELCSLREFNEYILHELKIAAERNKLKGFEYISKIVVDPQPFNIERDLVTATLKKKRSQMLKYYKAEIEQVYKNLAEGNK